MSARLSRIALPLCLVLSVAPGCSKTKSKTSSSSAPTLTKVSSVQPTPLPIAKTDPHSQELGHFIIDDIAGFWKGIDQVASAPGESKLPDLRLLLQTQLADSKIPERLMLDRPIGCVVYDPTQYFAGSSWPGVCFFSYQGGAKAFIEDLGKYIKPLKPEGHRFHASIENKDLFVDELDNTVILSGETSRFAASTNYLKSNIFKREILGPGLTFNMFLGDIYKRYEPIIQSQFKEITKPGSTSLALMGADKKSAEETLKIINDIFRESDQFRFNLYADQHRYHVTSSLRVNDKATEWQKIVSQGPKKPLSTELIARMPQDLMMLIATRPRPLNTELSIKNSLVGWKSIGKVLKQDEAWAKEMLKREQSFSKFLGDEATFGIVKDPKGAGSLVSLVQVAPKLSLQEKWRTELANLPTMNFGKKFHQNFTLAFTPKAKTEQGVVLDELKITAKDSALKELQTSIGQESYTSLISWLGGTSLVFHLGQVEHVAIAVASTRDINAASTSAIAALRGKKNFVLNPAYADIAKRFSGNSFAGVLDSAALSQTLKSAKLVGKSTAQDPRPGFQDSQFVSRTDPKEGTTTTGSISTALIPILVEVIKQQTSLGALVR